MLLCLSEQFSCFLISIIPERERQALVVFSLSAPAANADVSAKQLKQRFSPPAPSRYLLKREEEAERLFNYARRPPRRGAPVKRRTAGKCSFPLVS